MTEAPGARRLIAFGVALAIPLAAVALYFAIFEPGEPPGAAPPAPQASAALPPNHPPVAGTEGQGERHPQMGGPGRTVRVPESVKGKWQAVRLQVEQKDGKGRPAIYTVKLGGSLDIPETGLRLQVAEFLPALQVKDNEVTSSSNDPSNPAALIKVTEGEREAFRGWLFSKFPEMQPFEHSKVKITLLEGVPKS
ncbi:MAG: hypothetical protein ACE147_16080 [Candidatus Methylomirabilales bacterium]